jgi:sterol desaturase/sphingolipid hydroxylase (fatty acid hydroxylase superfamily)
MISETDTVGTITRLGAASEDKVATTLRRIVFDLVFTALLIGLVIFGALNLGPAISGKPKQLIGAILIATLLPIGTLVLLSGIERLLPPAGPRKSLRSWFLHLHIKVFYVFMAGLATVLATIASSALARKFGFSLGLIDLRFAEGKGLLVLLGSLWVGAIAGDFFFYWFHRTLHKTPFLWAHHKMHHMDRELEALTVDRQNWIEVFIAALLITMPVAIVFKLGDLDPWKLGLLGGLVTTVFGTLLTLGHMNVRLQVGKASLFYCSPQMHRIHHSRLPEHQDKNFAFVFPLWDVLFGSYYAPAWNEFPPTGVEGEKEIQSFWESQIFTQREWWRMFRAWRARRATRSA